MREIKFRAWDKANNILTYNLPAIYCEMMRDAEVSRASIRYEFMQYTGLKDKNGKEIYEGDIVTLLDLEHGEELLTISVKWSEQGLNFNVYPSHDPKKDWVVIGNIYENKELLEAKK